MKWVIDKQTIGQERVKLGDAPDGVYLWLEPDEHDERASYFVKHKDHVLYLSLDNSITIQAITEHFNYAVLPCKLQATLVLE